MDKWLSLPFSLSRLETSLSLTSRHGDARCRRLDLPSTRLADWDQDAPGDGICEGATLSLLKRALPSGGLRERARRGRARPRSGDALVAVMEPADLGNGVDPAV